MVDTNIKKTPDIAEVAVGGKDKLAVVKNLIGKELNMSDFWKGDLVDVRGLTKGKGLSGPVDRFGISLKAHKSEKGRRRPGSLGAWTPAKVSFRSPMAGQLGLFTRVQYNNQILISGKKEDAQTLGEFRDYGIIKNNYLIPDTNS